MVFISVVEDSVVVVLSKIGMLLFPSLSAA